MTTALTTPAPATRSRTRPAPGSPATDRGIPLGRIIGIELRKMFDTRSGFWLMSSIGILAVVATSAVILFAGKDELTYNTFATAIGFPMTVVLPIIAILSVTSEWSQRSGLTTFTLVPDRGRVIAAKAIACIGVAVATIPLGYGIGAVGNLVGAAVTGVDPVWDLTVTHVLTVILANVLGLMVGFTLGVLFRSSTGSIVAYFIYAFLLPTLSVLLAASQEWFRNLQHWVDFKFAQGALLDGTVSHQQWLDLVVTATFWLVVPLAVGLGIVMRAEVK